MNNCEYTNFISKSKGGLFIKDIRIHLAEFYTECEVPENISSQTLYIAEDFDYSILYEGFSEEDAIQSFKNRHPEFEEGSIRHFIVEKQPTIENIKSVNSQYSQYD